MRASLLLSLTLLTSGCWTPGLGQRDPTRYPWDPRNKVIVTAVPDSRIVAKGQIAPDTSWHPAAPSTTRESSYCVMGIEDESKSGSIANGNGGTMTCSAPLNHVPSSTPR
jgi:hypothetical protein